MRKPTSKKYFNFVKQLNENRSGMIAERLTTNEADFAKKYETSRNTVNKLMGHCPIKNLRQERRQKLPIDEINKLRLTLSDTEIAYKYKTYTSNIGAQCGSRKKLGIKQIHIITVAQRNRMKKVEVVKVVEEVKTLKENKWETPKPTAYELSWQKESVNLDRPHPTFYSKLK